MDVWVELLALRVELINTEALKCGVHYTLSHIHAFLDLLEVFAKLFDILDLVCLYFISEIIAHLKVVTHIEQVLRKLSYSEFSGRVDLLLVSLDCVVILGKLINQLILVLLNLFLEGLNLLILFPNKFLDLLNVLFRESLTSGTLLI